MIRNSMTQKPQTFLAWLVNAALILILTSNTALAAEQAKGLSQTKTRLLHS